MRRFSIDASDLDAPSSAFPCPCCLIDMGKWLIRAREKAKGELLANRDSHEGDDVPGTCCGHEQPTGLRIQPRHEIGDI